MLKRPALKINLETRFLELLAFRFGSNLAFELIEARTLIGIKKGEILILRLAIFKFLFHNICTSEERITFRKTWRFFDGPFFLHVLTMVIKAMKARQAMSIQVAQVPGDVWNGAKVIVCSVMWIVGLCC